MLVDICAVSGHLQCPLTCGGIEPGVWQQRLDEAMAAAPPELRASLARLQDPLHPVQGPPMPGGEERLPIAVLAAQLLGGTGLSIETAADVFRYCDEFDYDDEDMLRTTVRLQLASTERLFFDEVLAKLHGVLGLDDTLLDIVIVSTEFIPYLLQGKIERVLRMDTINNGAAAAAGVFRLYERHLANIQRVFHTLPRTVRRCMFPYDGWMDDIARHMNARPM